MAAGEGNDGPDTNLGPAQRLGAQIDSWSIGLARRGRESSGALNRRLDTMARTSLPRCCAAGSARLCPALLWLRNSASPRLFASLQTFYLLDRYVAAGIFGSFRSHQRGLVRYGLMTLMLLVVLAGGAAGVGLMAYRSYSAGFVPPDQVGVNQPSGGAKVLDRNGQLLFQYVDSNAGLRQPVPLDQISPALLATTIATEDATFYANPGVSYSGLGRAMWENVNPFGGPLKGSGGSSITQQLVKNVYFTSSQRSQRSLSRKAKETIYAFKLTDRYPKEQILTWYLNQISYGGLFNGIEAASEGYFGKPAKDLTLAEAALLAGIPQSPANFDPFLDPDAAVKRRNEVLDLLAQHKSVRITSDTSYMATPQEIEAAKAEPLHLNPKQPFDIQAPHFVLTYLQPELEKRFGHDALFHGGLVITTTLDLNLQNQAQGALEAHISQYEQQSNDHNGAAVIIDPKTGELLAMVGSRDYNRDDIQGKNNNLLALNSPGSTFKPFVYLASFLKLNAAPGTLIDDSPVSYKQADGSVFSPHNPANNYQGLITVRKALGSSLNVPAFKAAASTGVDDVVKLGKSVGLTTLNGSYGPSIALGGVDVKPLDLAYAYTVLANGGLIRGEAPATAHPAGERELDPIAILKITHNDGQVLFDISSVRGERRVAPEDQVYLVNSILTDPQAECLTFGCGGLSVPGYEVAVKTGTSEPYDPNGPDAGKIGETWAFGYTPDVVVGIWAGNADNSPITNVLSTSIAFQAMKDVVLNFYNGRPATPFTQPAGVVKARICYTAPTATCVEDYLPRSSIQGPAGTAPAPPAPVAATGPSAPANPQPPAPPIAQATAASVPPIAQQPAPPAATNRAPTQVQQAQQQKPEAKPKNNKH